MSLPVQCVCVCVCSRDVRGEECSCGEEGEVSSAAGCEPSPRNPPPPTSLFYAPSVLVTADAGSRHVSRGMLTHVEAEKPVGTGPCGKSVRACALCSCFSLQHSSTPPQTLLSCFIWRPCRMRAEHLDNSLSHRHDIVLQFYCIIRLNPQIIMQATRSNLETSQIKVYCFRPERGAVMVFLMPCCVWTKLHCPGIRLRGRSHCQYLQALCFVLIFWTDLRPRPSETP